MTPAEIVARELCESRKFETGHGTCALLCMDQLGDARGQQHGCPHRAKVFSALAERIVSALAE